MVRTRSSWIGVVILIFLTHGRGALARELLGAATPAAPSSPGAVESYRVAIDLAALSSEAPRLALSLPDGRKFELVRADVERREGAGATWRGRVEPGGGDVVLTVHRGRAAGLIYAGGEAWELSTADDGHRLERLDHDRFPECAENVPGDASIAALVTEAPVGPGGAPVWVDVLVVYTAQARDGAGGTAAIEATAQAAVDVANVAFEASDVDVRFRLLATSLAAHDDSGNSSTDLSWVRNDPATAALRDAVGADLVSLIVENGAGVCGRGYLGPSPSSVYQVSARGCAVGNLTWAHEHGHNLGMQHDPANGNSPAGAWRPWAFGHFVSTSPSPPGGNFRTVMSYSAPCPFGCTRVPRFSNPDVTYNGEPTGMDDGVCDPGTYLPGDPNAWSCRDNHRVADESGPIVATYRDRPPGIFADGFESGDASAWSATAP